MLCPRCETSLALKGHGVLRDAHGVFVPASALKRQVNLGAVAAMAAAFDRGQHSGIGCPSCRAAMQQARVPLPEQADMTVHGCLACGAWWIDAPELERLRAAMLSRPRTPPPRVLGGYGGTTVSRGEGGWGLAELVSSVLTNLGAFVA